MAVEGVIEIIINSTLIYGILYTSTFISNTLNKNIG